MKHILTIDAASHKKLLLNDKKHYNSLATEIIGRSLYTSANEPKDAHIAYELHNDGSIKTLIMSNSLGEKLPLSNELSYRKAVLKIYKRETKCYCLDWQKKEFCDNNCHT